MVSTWVKHIKIDNKSVSLLLISNKGLTFNGLLTMATLNYQSSDILVYLCSFLDTPTVVQLWQASKRFHYVIGELVPVPFYYYSPEDKPSEAHLKMVFKRAVIIDGLNVDHPIPNQRWHCMSIGGHDYYNNPFLW